MAAIFCAFMSPDFLLGISLLKKKIEMNYFASAQKRLKSGLLYILLQKVNKR